MLAIVAVNQSIMGRPPLQDKLSTRPSRFRPNLRQSPVYDKGVRLKPKEMKALESEVIRLAGLGKWFVEIPAKVRDG